MGRRGWVQTPWISYLPQDFHRTAMLFSGIRIEPYLGWYRGTELPSHISRAVCIFGAQSLPLVPLTPHAALFSCPCPCLHWERQPGCQKSWCWIPHAHQLLPRLVRIMWILWEKLRLRVPPFCVVSGHPRMFDPSPSLPYEPLKTLGIRVRPNSFPWSGVWLIRDKMYP